MSNIHRIIWIDERLRQRRFPDRRVISEKFEISIRQAARDIEYMKNTLGAPIHYSSFKKGYYYEDHNTFTLPSQFITTKERNLLQNLAAQYAKYGGGQSAQVVALFNRLTWHERNEGKGLDNLPTMTMEITKDDNGDGTIASYREPYVTIVQIKGVKEVRGLKHPVRKIDDDKYEVKFYESDKLLSELLSRFTWFCIVSPRWLKRKLRLRLNKILENH